MAQARGKTKSIAQIFASGFSERDGFVRRADRAHLVLVVASPGSGMRGAASRTPGAPEMPLAAWDKRAGTDTPTFS